MKRDMELVRWILLRVESDEPLISEEYEEKAILYP